MRLNGLRKAGIAAEVTVAATSMAIIASYYMSPDTLAQLRPHPFGIVVLVASLQYGTLGGAVAAGTGTAALFALGWPQAGIEEDRFTYLARAWSDPALWLALMLLVGELRDRQIVRERELETALACADRERQAIADHNVQMRARIDALERQISLQLKPPGKELLTRLAALQAHGCGASETAIGALAKLLLDTDGISVWAARPDGLHLVVAAGWSERSRWLRRFSVEHPLYVAAVEGRQRLSLTRPSDRSALAGEGVAVTPIVLDTSGPTLGILKVEKYDGAALDRFDEEALALMAGELALRWQWLGAPAGTRPACADAVQ